MKKFRLTARPTIIIDTREQKPLFQASAAGDKDVRSYIVEKVDEGDYTVQDIPYLVVVERKADGLELWSNLTRSKDRFMREVERLRQYKYKYIVIQQSYDDFLNPDNWRPLRSIKKRLAAIAAIESWLFALQQHENIHFIFAGRHIARVTRKILCKTYEYERKRLMREENDKQNQTTEFA